MDVGYQLGALSIKQAARGAMFRLLSDLSPPHDWALAVAACAVLAGFAAIVVIVVHGSRGSRWTNKGRLLDLALNNMTQGVVMFDRTGRLVVRNDRYLEMYGLPADIVKAG